VLLAIPGNLLVEKGRERVFDSFFFPDIGGSSTSNNLDEMRSRYDEYKENYHFMRKEDGVKHSGIPP